MVGSMKRLLMMSEAGAFAVTPSGRLNTSIPIGRSRLSPYTAVADAAPTEPAETSTENKKLTGVSRGTPSDLGK